VLLADAVVASMASAPATSRFGNVRGEVGMDPHPRPQTRSRAYTTEEGFSGSHRAVPVPVRTGMGRLNLGIYIRVRVGRAGSGRVWSGGVCVFLGGGELIQENDLAFAFPVGRRRRRGPHATRGVSRKDGRLGILCFRLLASKSRRR